MNENLAMDSAKQHIEKIRKERFWIGVGQNPLSKPLRMAVKYLSAELYSKDVHFLMELIQVCLFPCALFVFNASLSWILFLGSCCLSFLEMV